MYHNYDKTGHFVVCKNKICPVFIPSKISIQAIDIIPSTKSINLNYSELLSQNLSLFFIKFISGDKNTRNGFADIATLDLYLWEVAKVSKHKHVKSVCNSINRFKHALFELDVNTLTVSNLIQINKKLRPKAYSYGIRKGDVKAGDPKTNPYAFYCIPPEKILDYLEDLIGFIKSEVKNDTNKALITSQQFIFIHPFADGNGRISRLLMLKIMQEKYGLVYSYLLSIYLKNINRDNYHLAVHKYQHNDIQTFKMFLIEAVNWTNQSVEILYKFLDEYESIIGELNLKNNINYSKIIIKVDVNDKINEELFQLHSKKGGKNIYINSALLNVLNQFDYYLRYELRKHQNN